MSISQRWFQRNTTGCVPGWLAKTQIHAPELQAGSPENRHLLREQPHRENISGALIGTFFFLLFSPSNLIKTPERLNNNLALFIAPSYLSGIGWSSRELCLKRNKSHLWGLGWRHRIRVNLELSQWELINSRWGEEPRRALWPCPESPGRSMCILDGHGH